VLELQSNLGKRIAADSAAYEHLQLDELPFHGAVSDRPADILPNLRPHSLRDLFTATGGGTLRTVTCVQLLACSRRYELPKDAGAPAQEESMDFGAHLPLMDFGGQRYTVKRLIDYTQTAVRLGFTILSANDHMLFPVPWLDGPTALAAVTAHTGALTLATTVALPVVRGPVPLAKALAAIDLLSGGRLLVVVGPGSSRRDYEAVGIDFAERWQRLDEAVVALRALWAGDGKAFVGRFYSTEGLDLRPRPAQRGGPPIWIGSWGSSAGLHRVARLGDGWLASAYNTTPELFADVWARLRADLVEHGRNPDGFPNGLATMWFHITEDQTEADRILRQRVFPAVNRPEDELRERLPVGPAEVFAEKLAGYRDAGAQRVLVWPVADEQRQLELFCEKVRPALRS
jgi:probable F420-dependent oxidoreductase